MEEKKIGNFRPLGSGFGVQPGTASPDGRSGGDLHDTFKVDKIGNVSKGHTTVNLGGEIKTSVYWKSDKNV
ncbi:MAG: hypothetical protein AAGH87_01085 [Pseudomonadota bacterium]